MEAFGATLALLGAASMVAAIAGALNLAGVAEIPAMQSAALRVLLAVVGVVFLLVGIGFAGSGVATPPGGGPGGGQSGSAGDGGSPSRTPSEVPDGGGGAGRDTYSAAANRACTTASQGVSSLPSPDPDAPDGEWAEYAFGYAEVLASLQAELSGVTPTPGAIEDHSSWLFQLGLMQSSIESAAIALRAGDPAGYDQHLDEADQYKTAANRLAQRLSLSECQFS